MKADRDDDCGVQFVAERTNTSKRKTLQARHDALVAVRMEHHAAAESDQIEDRTFLKHHSGVNFGSDNHHLMIRT